MGVKPLSGLDALFLHLETPETPMHVGSLSRYDLPAAERAPLKQRLGVLTTTDMAVIVSPGQNEIEQMKKHGLDIG